MEGIPGLNNNQVLDYFKTQSLSQLHPRTTSFMLLSLSPSMISLLLDTQSSLKVVSSDETVLKHNYWNYYEIISKEMLILD